MAQVRQDAPRRSAHIQAQSVPDAPIPQAAQAPERGARTKPARTVVRDGFEAANTRGPRAGAKARAPGDTFEAAPKAPAATGPAPRQPALGPKMQRAYGSLAPDQRGRFDQLLGAAQAVPTQKAKAVKQVQSLLGADGGFKHYDLVDQAVRGRGEAPAALQQLLFSGRLTEGKGPLRQNALEHLGVLASQQRTPTGLDSHALLADVVLDLARPGRIQQGANNLDCGGTAAAVILTKTKPSEYARIVTDLGTKGATTVGDQVWTASPPKGQDAANGRSLSQQLFAATYVRQTNDPTIPPTSDAQIQGLLNGEYGREMAKGLRTLTGRDYQAAFIPATGESNLIAHRAAVSGALNTIAQHLDKGAPIALNVDNHWVVATGSEGPRGKSSLLVADGSGGLSSIPVKDLQDRLQGFVFDGAISSVPMDLRFRRHDKPGGGGDTSDGAQPTGSRYRN